MQANLVETLIGAVVLIVAGAFLYVGYTSTDVSAGGGGYELEARFNRADGLTRGTDVRISGIKVGSVTDQKLDPQSYQAVITFSVDRSVELSADTIASVSSDGLLGGNYLSLSPGGSPDLLADGDIVEFTNDSVDLFSLISKAVFTYANDDGEDGDAESAQ